jgi:AraC family transcriptional regulator
MMSNSYPDLPKGALWSVTGVFYSANAYQHPPAGLLQLRVVRRGSSYADIDLGHGSRRVFTRPGDLLLSFPDRSTAFRIAEGRELTLLQIKPKLAELLVQRAGGAALDDLRPLSHRPVREPLVAELVRRLEADDFGAAEGRDWALGLIVASLLVAARGLPGAKSVGVLSQTKLRELLGRVEQDLAVHWSVEDLAHVAGLPRRRFAASFKEAMGLPVHQYLLRLRAERAAVLLRETDLSIAQIASRTGFAHQAHLTRVTSSMLGASPNRIREGTGRPE